jgi:hypothetical protein
MCMSVNINWYGLPASRAANNSFNAFPPLSACVGCICQRRAMPSKMTKFVRLSSTIKTFTPAKTSGPTCGLTTVFLASAISTGIVK